MQHTESSVGERGALNIEWKVLPRCSKLPAIPVNPTARATDPEFPSSLHLTAARIELSTNVFPVQPLASMKRSIWRSVLTADITILKTSDCESVNIACLPVNNFES